MQPVILLLLLFFAVNSFAQTDSGWDRYVGRAGDVYISEKEFQQRFEMLPALNRQRKSQIDIAKRELMLSLVAEKLLVQEARSRNLDSDSLYQHAMLEIRKLLARDQLYREEISQKVSVAPREITAGIQAARKQILTAFIYFDDEEEARFVRERLKRPADFDTFILDSSMNALRDTASIVWGEALPAIEQAAYKLRAGEISPVVQAGEGYYILKCISVTPNSFFSSMPTQSLRERVVERIRSIKERERVDEFLRAAFTDQVAYSRPQPLKALADAITVVFSEQLQPVDSTVVMTSVAAGLVRAKVSSILNDTLTVVGDTYWSVGSVIERLVLKRFEVSRENLNRMFPRLNID
ncbi:hypothetical protein FBQ87_14890, partial [Sphingobacteriales bacterium CHB3]|nr:hypothetical protein [Sphingobacteriales bacterium CHB3]